MTEDKYKLKQRINFHKRGYIQMNHTRWQSYFIVALFAISLATFVNALPAGPVIDYVSNTTLVNTPANRTQDEKGTITTIEVTARQQDYKWKAYVGNVTGTLVLDNANAKSIYDWTMGTITGEVYVTRYSGSVSWANVTCVTPAVIDNEQTALGMVGTAADSINSTFNYTIHQTMLVGTKSITNSTCASTATYINDTRQDINESSYFQEVLLTENVNNPLIYSTFIENDQAAYDEELTFDFQLIVAENESSDTPLTYYFYVELG
jgi:hypothetical protein